MKKIVFISMLLLLGANAFADWKQDVSDGMSYFLYLPKNLSTDVKKQNSLMINLHGCSQKAEDLKQDGNWANASDEYNMIVALPKVPNGGKYMGCWDYYGADHTRSNRDNGPILKLVAALLSKKDLNIDPKQVYVSGLSSGGGESFVLGCLAPDVFAGIGLNAGPVIGTSSSEISTPPTSFDNYLNACKKLAGNNIESFKTQIASIIYGNNDYIVNTKHDLMNANVLSNVYNSKSKSTFDLKTLPGANTDGTGTLFSDTDGSRISMIMNTNLGHNWPAGQGGTGGSFINKKSINYPLYLAKFFTENNRRTKNVFRPKLNITSFDFTNSTLKITGSIKVSDSKKVNVSIYNLLNGNIKQDNLVNVRNNKFIYNSTKFMTEGPYEVALSFDENGVVKTIMRHFWVGEIPSEMIPQLYNVKFNANSACAKVVGQAIPNGTVPLKNVQIVFDAEAVAEIPVINTFFEYENCQINKGQHSLKVFAINENNLASNAFETNFVFNENEATANLQDHMMAGRLIWKDYAVWFFKYQDKPFTLYLNSNGTWSDKL